jgi:CheY-like chemotaxis protein
MILDSPDKVINLKTKTGKIQILYVEDDRNSQFLVEQVLRNSYDVDIAPHARDVMTWVGLKDYDLILMDIKLDEGYSGIELAKKIKNLPHYKDVPILAVTAIAFPEELANMVLEGCSDTITKPIDFKLFKSKISDLLMKAQDTNGTNSAMYF